MSDYNFDDTDLDGNSIRPNEEEQFVSIYELFYNKAFMNSKPGDIRVKSGKLYEALALEEIQKSLRDSGCHFELTPNWHYAYRDKRSQINGLIQSAKEMLYGADKKGLEENAFQAEADAILFIAHPEKDSVSLKIGMVQNEFKLPAMVAVEISEDGSKKELRKKMTQLLRDSVLCHLCDLEDFLPTVCHGNALGPEFKKLALKNLNLLLVSDGFNPAQSSQSFTDILCENEEIGKTL